MGDKNPGIVFNGLELLKEKDITINGSIVAMPHLNGWKYLSRTIERLKSYKVETIRIFMPGFTKWTDDCLQFSIKKMYARLNRLVNNYKSSDVPILLEPPTIHDLTCRIKGIIGGTPADMSPLSTGDIITSVNGNNILSRVDGFNRIKNYTNPSIEYKHNNYLYNIIIKKNSGDRSGIVMDYDIEPVLINKLDNILNDNNNREICIITSILARDIMKQVLRLLDRNNKKKIDLLAVKNNYFGGSIVCAGLLVNDDIVRVIASKSKKYELILLPGIIYDIFGNDLTGKSYKELEKKLNVQVEIV